jgi:hypothetical protein
MTAARARTCRARPARAVHPRPPPPRSPHLHKALEQHAHGYEVLGAPHRQREVHAAVGQVVAADGRAALVGPHAAQQRGPGRVVGAALEVRAALQAHHIVPALRGVVRGGVRGAVRGVVRGAVVCA